MAFDLLPDHEHVRRPWLNGGGMTAEVAACPPGADAGSDFVWRVSFADVAGSGDFSTFSGVDRVITLIEGPPMTLELPGETTVLRPLEPYSFDGGLPVVCTVSGPTRDLNVMTRRGRASATVEVVQLRQGEAPMQAEGGVEKAPVTLLLAALAGSAHVTAAGMTALLAPGDVITTDEAVSIEGEGSIAVIHLTLTPTPTR